MVGTPRERLQATTKMAQEARIVDVDTEKRLARSASAQQAAETRRFLAAHLSQELDRASKILERESELGKSSAEIILEVSDGRWGEDTEAVRKYRVLRQKIAEHFVLEGLDVVTFEDRPQVRNPRIPISDGYSEECPPMMDAGYTALGLRLNWMECEAAS